MNWYVPITFLPAVALLILSTSNLLIALNTEIDALRQRDSEQSVPLIQAKLEQLKKLTVVLSFFYTSALLFTLAALSGALNQIRFVAFPLPTTWILILGVVTMLLGLVLLFLYSINAVQIRQKQHRPSGRKK